MVNENEGNTFFLGVSVYRFPFAPEEDKVCTGRIEISIFLEVVATCLYEKKIIWDFYIMPCNFFIYKNLRRTSRNV